MSNSTFTVNIGAISPWSVAEAFQQCKIAAGSITNVTKNVKVVCFKHVHSFEETSSQELHLQTLLTCEVGPNHIEVGGNIPPHELQDVGCLMCAKIGIQQFINIMQTTQLIWTNGNTNDAVVFRMPHHLSFEERWEKKKTTEMEPEVKWSSLSLSHWVKI